MNEAFKSTFFKTAILLLLLQFCRSTQTLTYFSTGSDSWGPNPQIDCGGQKVSGYEDQNTILTSSITFLRIPFKIDYTFDFYFFGNMGANDLFYLYIDDYQIMNWTIFPADLLYDGSNYLSCGSNPAYTPVQRYSYSGSISTSPPLYTTKTFDFTFRNDLSVQYTVAAWGVSKFTLVGHICHESCMTCTSEAATGCLTCAHGYVAYHNTDGSLSCLTECPDYYTDVSGVCTRCTHPACIKCETPDFCTQCNATAFYLTPDSTCGDCDVSCHTCNDGTGLTCTSCNTGFYVYQKQTDLTMQCIFPCPARYTYTNNASYPEWCLPCTDPHCSRCSPDNICSLCDPGYYLDSSTYKCHICDNSCGICDGVTNGDCLTCQNGLYVYNRQETGKSQCLSECPGKYTPVDGVCYPCGDSICEECSSPNNCTRCPTDYYYLTDLKTCGRCSTGCKTCLSDSPDMCTSCDSGYKIFQAIPVPTSNIMQCLTSCPYKYATVAQGANPAICKPCQVENCVECGSDSNSCQKCASEEYLLNNNVCLHPITWSNLPVFANSTLIIYFSIPIINILDGPPTQYFDISLDGVSPGAYIFNLTASPDNMTLNLTFGWLETVPAGTILTFSFKSSYGSTYYYQNGYYLPSTAITVALPGYQVVVSEFPSKTNTVTHYGGPVIASMYLISLALSHEGSVFLGAAVSLEILAMMRFVNIEYPGNLVDFFNATQYRPIPFLFPLNFNLFKLDTTVLVNTFPPTSNVFQFLASSDFLYNVDQDFFSAIILALVLGFVFLLEWLFRKSGSRVGEVFYRIRIFLAWNLTLTVVASASLRNSFFAFLDFAYTEFSNGFSVVSFISALIAAVFWFIGIIVLMTYANRKRMRRLAKGKECKEWKDRGRLDVVYEEFKEGKYLHKYYFPAFLLRNYTMGAALAWLQNFPVMLTTVIWMIQGAFTLSLVIVRPWRVFYKLPLHLLFDIPLLVALSFMIALGVANEEPGFSLDYKAALASGFITIYLVLLALNFALGPALMGLSIFKLFSKPPPPKPNKSPKIVRVKRKDEPVTPVHDVTPDSDSRVGDFTSVSIVERKGEEDFPGLDPSTTRIDPNTTRYDPNTTRPLEEETTIRSNKRGPSTIVMLGHYVIEKKLTMHDFVKENYDKDKPNN